MEISLNRTCIARLIALGLTYAPGSGRPFGGGLVGTTIAEGFDSGPYPKRFFAATVQRYFFPPMSLVTRMGDTDRFFVAGLPPPGSGLTGRAVVGDCGAPVARRLREPDQDGLLARGSRPRRKD